MSSHGSEAEAQGLSLSRWRLEGEGLLETSDDSAPPAEGEPEKDAGSYVLCSQRLQRGAPRGTLAGMEPAPNAPEPEPASDRRGPRLVRLPVWLVSTVARLALFARRVGSGFIANKGLLLAGSVAYNTLLSVIPLFAVSLAVLSYFFEEERILEAIRLELDVLVPGQADALSAEIAGFLEHRQLVWGLGFFVLLFFSSLAFRMLADAIEVIFHRRALAPLEGSRLRQPLKRVLKRDFWVSAVIPYAYIGTVVLTLVALTVLLSLIGRVGDGAEEGSLPARGLWLVGFGGQVVLFASIYKVMPAAHISMRRALTGGLAAAVLWEGARRFLTWYFVNLSLVGAVYGSLTTVVIVLLGLEVGAIIVLLGAQVIAELERSEAAGVLWWQAPREDAAEQPPGLS